MISIDNARDIVLDHTKRLAPESIPILDARDAVLAEALQVRENHPPFDSSAVDGFAVRALDLAQAGASNPISLRLISTIRAGQDSNDEVQPGTAIRIMTGAPIPLGADAVVMKEDTEVVEEAVVFRGALASGKNIRTAGEEFKAGDVALSAGISMTPAVIALLASLGYDTIQIFKRPRVAIITTGDELAPISGPLGRGKIRDSNAAFLRSALDELGIQDVKLFERVQDNPDSLRSALESVLTTSDVVIVTGGVSVGDFDYVKESLRGLAVEERFWGINVKPGKPTFFGTQGSTLVFGLPGNPVAVGVLFYELVRPALLKAMGHRNVMLQRVKAKLEATVTKRTVRLELVRGCVRRTEGGYSVMPLIGRESHMLGSLAGANCLMCIPSDLNAIAKDSDVEVHLLPWASNLFEDVERTTVDDPSKGPADLDKFDAEGKVTAISTSAKKGIPKTNTRSAMLKEAWGIEGDVHAGAWHRQVSLLALESIDKMRAKGLKVRPGAFAENITTEFIDVPMLHPGDRLRIGEAILEITQIGKECHAKCAIFFRAGDCVMPREGVFARVARGGRIQVGDAIEVSRRGIAPRAILVEHAHA